MILKSSLIQKKKKEDNDVRYQKAKRWEIILGMANNGADVAFYILMGYASMIAVEGYGIKMALAGTILTVMRICFGAMDAAIAGIFEKINPKRGKIRIFMLVGWFVCMAGALLLYIWCAGKFKGFAGIIVFILAYFVYLLGYSINSIGGGTVGIVITNEPRQRAMVGVVGTVFSYLIPIVFMNITTFAILPRYHQQYSIEMLAEMVVWYAVFSFVLVLLSCIGVSKVDVEKTFTVVSSEQKKQPVSFRDMWEMFKSNRNVQMYMLTGIANKLAQQTGTQTIIITLLNGVLIGNYVTTTMAGNFTQIIGIIFAFGGGIFISKWGARKCTVIWSWINIGVAISAVGFCLLLGGAYGMKKLGVMGIPLVLWVLLNLAKSGSMMVLTTANSAMRADIVDYEHSRSGKYMPAVISGIYSFVDKLVSSLGSTIAAVSITFVGYINRVPQLGDEVTWSKFWMCMFLVMGLPILGWICNIAAMKYYDLNKERMVEVQKCRQEFKTVTEKNHVI